MEHKIELFFSKESKWQKEYKLLRGIVLSCGLVEELKWGVPCYTHQSKNILIIHGFKNYCAINFFKGALLKDELKILIQQTENVQATRQIRFSEPSEIQKLESDIKAYIYEAIEIEEAGLKIEYKETKYFEVPAEFQDKLDSNADFKKAFSALTPGRQKAYLLFFSGAKQAKTREARIAKYKQRILNGIGFNDCVCGLSKKMPSCDGSHKYK